MSKKLLYILLLISLAFNLAFLGSFFYFRATHPRPPRDFPPPGMPGPEGRGRFPFEESDSTRALRGVFMETKQELMQELAKDTIDESSINNIIQRSLQAQATLEANLGKRLIELRKKMSAEEAKEFFSDRFKRMDDHKDFRFDKNKRRHRR